MIFDFAWPDCVSLVVLYVSYRKFIFSQCRYDSPVAPGLIVRTFRSQVDIPVVSKASVQPSQEIWQQFCWMFTWAQSHMRAGRKSLHNKTFTERKRQSRGRENLISMYVTAKLCEQYFLEGSPCLSAAKTKVLASSRIQQKRKVYSWSQARIKCKCMWDRKRRRVGIQRLNVYQTSNQTRRNPHL